MAINEHIRRDILQALAILPLIGLAAHAGEAAAQTAGSPVKVDTNGLVAKIKFEAPLSGFLSEINGKYKLRVTELTLAPGGHVGEHNHVGPGIRQVTSGYMTYVLRTRQSSTSQAISSSNPAISIIQFSTRPMNRWYTCCSKSCRWTSMGHRSFQ